MLDPNLSDQQLYTIASDTQHLSDEILLELRFHPNAYPSLTQWALEMLSLPPGHEGFPPPEPGEDLDDDFYTADTARTGGQQGGFFSRLLAVLPFGGGRSRDKSDRPGRREARRNHESARRSDWMREYGPDSGPRRDGTGKTSAPGSVTGRNVFAVDAWDSERPWAQPPERSGTQGRLGGTEPDGVASWDEVMGQDGSHLEDHVPDRDPFAVGGRDRTYDPRNRSDEGSVSLGFSSSAGLRDDALDGTFDEESTESDPHGERREFRAYGARGGDRRGSDDAGGNNADGDDGDAGDVDASANSGYARSTHGDPLLGDSPLLEARYSSHGWAHDDDDWDSDDDGESDEGDANQRDWFGTHQIEEREERHSISHAPALGSHDSSSIPQRHHTADSEISSLPLRREQPGHGQGFGQRDRDPYRPHSVSRNLRPRRAAEEDRESSSFFSQLPLPARLGMIAGIVLIVAMGGLTVYLRFISPGLAAAANANPAVDQPVPVAQSGQSEAQSATNAAVGGAPAQSGGAQPSATAAAPPVLKHLRAGQSSYECGSQGLGVTCWGYFAEDDYREAQEIQGLQERSIVKLAVGRNFGVAVDDSNTVWAWGINDRGQMGRVDGPPDVTTALEIGTVPAKPTQIIAAHDHTCLLVEGKVWCFGSNMAGQVTGIRSTDPAALTQMEGIADAVELGSSGYDMWALTPKGTWIWGNNTFRQAAPTEGGDGVGPTFIEGSPAQSQ